MTSMALSLALLLACGDKDGDDTGGSGDDLGNVQSQSLGSFTTDTGGLTGDIPLELPSGTSSALVHCGPYGGDLGTAWQIQDPAASNYYVNQFFEPYTATQMRVDNHQADLPILMPVSPDHDISAGAWKVNVWIASGGTPKTVDCSAVYRVESPGSTATVDVNAVFVGLADSMGIDASTAPSDADFQAAMDFVDTLWADAGLSVGEVNYIDFPGDASRYSVVNFDNGDLEDLFATEVGGAARGITIFFVEEITTGSGSTILGTAGTPPGAATVSGTSHSGMAVTTADLRDSTDDLGLIIAHEAAHFLGLFHTTEKLATAFDPLSDTPECPASADVDSSGFLDREECAGLGAENVMFWAPAPDVSTQMSGDQGWVLRRNPASR